MMGSKENKGDVSGSSGNLDRLIPVQPTQCGISPGYPLFIPTWTPVKFYVNHAVHLFTSERCADSATDFWRVSVPQMVHNDPFLRDALLGLTYLFKDCPRPQGLTNTQVMTLVQKTFLRVRELLNYRQRLARRDLLDLFLGTSFLAIATFLGVGSLASLRVHLDGLRAVINTFYGSLVEETSPLRQYLLGYRLPKNSMSSQLPLDLRHLHLVEPILRFISAEELLVDDFDDGGMIHMLTLTNRAIRLSERSHDPTGASSPADHADFAIFRELCEGRMRHQSFREMQSPPVDHTFYDGAESIWTVFEQAIFVYLKQIAVTRTQHHTTPDLYDDYKHLKACIDRAKTLNPFCRLIWPERVYNHFPPVAANHDIIMSVVKKEEVVASLSTDDQENLDNMVAFEMVHSLLKTRPSVSGTQFQELTTSDHLPAWPGADLTLYEQDCRTQYTDWHSNIGW